MIKPSVLRGPSALACLAAALAACSQEEAVEEGALFETATAERGTLTITAQATGEIEPVRRVEVKSKASGEILKLLVDVGDDVEPGALLAEIDPRDVQNAFNQAEADLAVAEERMAISEAERNRSARLLEAGVITPQENEGTRLDYANAQANLVKASTNLELAELRLNDVRIRAPMAGTIIQKNVEEGSVIQSASGNVSGGTTLFVMANLSEMQVRTRVDETDMGDLRPGMPTSIVVEAYRDDAFSGTLDKIEPQAEVVQNVTMFPVIISIPNPDGVLKPGMNTEVEIFIDQARDVLLVPNGAIVQTGDVGPAAMALGLDTENLDLGRLMMGGGFAGAAGPAGGGAEPRAVRTGAADGDPANVSSEENRPLRASDLAGGDERTGDAESDPTGGTSATERIQALREQAGSGAMSPDSMRAAMRNLRGRGAGTTGAGLAGAGAWPGGGRVAGGGGRSDSRRAVVFVVGADSLPEPRLVEIGLNDWDRTAILSGLEAGETLAIVGAAQLRARQEEWMNRMRERFGGGSPLGGGGGRGPRLP